MKRSINIVLLLCLSLAGTIMAQERDRRAVLDVKCVNPYVTHTSVAPDGSIWMATMCGEVFIADNIGSTWRTLREGELGSSGRDYENITAFNRQTAVVSGNIWDGGFKDIMRTATGGLFWDKVAYKSIKGGEWFHPAWRGEGGRMWIGSQDGMLAFSADSGRTFTTLRDTAFDRKTGIKEICMTSAECGFVGCSDNSLYATTDNWHHYRRLPTPFDQKVITRDGIVRHIRQWRDYLIVVQVDGSYYTPVKETIWKRTPVKLLYFEADSAAARLWGIDDNFRVVMTEDFEHWKQMGVSALFTIGIYDGRLYCRIEEGVIRVGADGAVDSCLFLTTERPLGEPKTTLAHGRRMWGSDGKGVYILDSQGWYRVAWEPYFGGMTPDPDSEDRVVIMTDDNRNYAVDTAGRVEPYTYPQPTAAFLKSGLRSLSIQTYRNLGYNYIREEIAYNRVGDSLVKTLSSVEGDSVFWRRVPVAGVEWALLALGADYSRYPTPQDFGLEDTTLDLHDIFEVKTTGSSSNKYGYVVTFVNQEGDSLIAFGRTDSHCNFGGSTRFPWLLPMYVSCREAFFVTYQPVLWQTLRNAMPDSMMLRDYLDNSTLCPEVKLRSGDLLFLGNDLWYRTEMDKAIEASTGNYTHVAMMEVDSLGVEWIIEATPRDGVERKTFDRFLEENHLHMFGTLSIFRLAVPFDTAAVVARAHSFLGQAYDDCFLPNNGKMYCSELIYECFLDTAGKHLFEAKPMNWRDAEGQLPKYWKEHFRKLGMKVPEGVPGTNPTDLSRSPLLRKL